VKVEDLGSRNGTFLNGKNVTTPTVLSPGDTLTVGGATITIGGGSAGSTVPVARPSPLDFGERSVLRPAAELLQLEESGPLPAEIREEAQLRRYAERLRIVNEVHQALARSIALEELLELILDRAFDHLKPEEGAIFLKRGREYYCAASRSSRSSRGGTLFSRRLVEEVAEKGLAALVIDTQIDERFKVAMSIMGAGVRSLVAAPLSDGARPLGMIVLGSLYAVRQFTEEDMELLVSLASVAALRIANVALTEEAAERRRLDQEVALARRIQEALLPDALPEVPGFEVFGSNFPSQGVSGDYYQVRPRLGAGGRARVIDVSSGHQRFATPRQSKRCVAARGQPAGRRDLQPSLAAAVPAPRRSTPPGFSPCSSPGAACCGFATPATFLGWCCAVTAPPSGWATAGRRSACCPARLM
jgi:hypothetical protein